jgi:hypothetical protein
MQLSDDAERMQAILFLPTVPAQIVPRLAARSDSSLWTRLNRPDLGRLAAQGASRIDDEAHLLPDANNRLIVY